MKYAMTADGKTAAYTGKSQWITGEAARRRVHQDRHRYMAIMAGVGTVLTDDPLLTCRMENGKNPIRIICDTQLRTPLSARLVTTAGDVTTMIATACTDADKHRPYIEAGCRIITAARKGDHLDLAEVMQELGRQGIDSVYLEGGAALNWSALEAGLVQKVQAYIAPKILGGQDAKTPVAGRGAPSPDEAFALSRGTITVLGDDILIESEVKPTCSPE